MHSSRLLFLILTVLTLMPSAHVLAEERPVGQFMTGNSLWELCSADEDDEIGAIYVGRCNGYIIGVVDAAKVIPELEGAKSSICTPIGLTQGQAQDVVKLYVKNNPDKRHWAASFLVVMALKSSWACKNENN